LISMHTTEKKKRGCCMPEITIKNLLIIEFYVLLLFQVIPSPPVPKTSQGFIGWRSAVPKLGLERGFQIQSCKGTFFKDLKWPCEASD
ncbi:Uncharacterized protein C20orf85, partial [Apaloderma vittatum]